MCNIAIERLIMTQNLPRRSHCIALRANHQGARTGVTGLALDLEKHATDLKSKSKTKFMKCKRAINISTFNVRTLHTICQQSELIESAINQLTDIICIQEHRYFHEEIILKYHKMGKNWTLITASSWKNSSNSTIGGVEMLLSPHALKSLINIEKISPRIVVATFNGNPQTTIISCYSPTNVLEEQDVLHFSNELASLVRAVPRHNMLIITGDMNAQLGRNQHHKHAFHAETNRNEKHFNHFLTENNLYCLNTRFKKREGSYGLIHTQIQ